MSDLTNKINSILSSTGKSEVQITESEANAMLQAIGWEEIRKASNVTSQQTAPSVGNKNAEVGPDPMKKKNPNSSDIVQEEDEEVDENNEEINEEELEEEEYNEELSEAKKDDSKDEDEEGENDNDEDDEDEKKSKKKMPFQFKKKAMKEEEEAQVQEHITALLSGQDTLTEDFKNKAKTIFEAALAERESAIVQQLVEEADQYIAEQLEQDREELVEHLDGYLNYIAEEWLENNQLEVDNGLRNEISESFIAGLRDLFLEHNMDVPEETPDVLDEMQQRMEELESSLNEEMLKNAELVEILSEQVKKEAIQEQLKGLTPVEADKFKKIAESVEFSNVDEFAQKLTVLKESYITNKKDVNKNKKDDMTELTENERNNEPDYIDPTVKILSEQMPRLGYNK